jgi:hypothetical protein
MGNQALIPERFIAELDRLGTAVVRQRLAGGAWGKAGQKAKLARQWLAESDRRTAAARMPQPEASPARPAPPRPVASVIGGGRAEPFPGSQEAVRRSAAAAEESADLAESAYAIARDANFRAAMALAVAAASLLVHLMLVLVRPA